MIFRPLLNGPRALLVRFMKRSKLIYRIKTRQKLSRWESLKVRLRKPECFLKDLFQGSPSRISSPLAGHPAAYEKFVMDKHMNTKNTQQRYLSTDFPISKSLIS